MSELIDNKELDKTVDELNSIGKYTTIAKTFGSLQKLVDDLMLETMVYWQQKEYPKYQITINFYPDLNGNNGKFACLLYPNKKAAVAASDKLNKALDEFQHELDEFQHEFGGSPNYFLTLSTIDSLRFVWNGNVHSSLLKGKQ